MKRGLAALLGRNKCNSGSSSGSSSNAEGVKHAPWKLSMGSMTFGLVQSVTVNPSDTCVCMGFADGTIEIWDMEIQEKKLTLEDHTGHTGQVLGLTFDSKDPVHLFSADDDKDDNSVKCWDIEKNKVIRSYQGHYGGVYSLALHPTLDVLITGGGGGVGGDSVCRMWDIRCQKQILVLCGHQDAVSSVFTRPSDPQVITGSHDKTIKLWDFRNLEMAMHMVREGGPEDTGTLARETLTHHKKPVRALAAHPTDDCFVSASADKIKKFKLPEGEFMHNMPSRQKTIINSVAVNKEGVLATAGDDGSMWFWDWTSGHSFQKCSLGARIHSITYDMSGGRLFACGDHWIRMLTDHWDQLTEDNMATP